MTTSGTTKHHCNKEYCSNLL